MISNLIGWLVTTVIAAAQPVAGVVGVTLDDAFQLVGSNSSGLIATINITSLAPGMSRAISSGACSTTRER